MNSNNTAVWIKVTSLSGKPMLVDVNRFHHMVSGEDAVYTVLVGGSEISPIKIKETVEEVWDMFG